MKLNKRRVMQDAHIRYRQGQRLNMGWTFSQCLKTAWAAEKQRQPTKHNNRDFIWLQAA